MKRINIIQSLGFIFISLIASASFAQTGDVEIIKDNRLDALVAKQAEVVPPAVRPQIDGYRIQLFFDSERAKINNAMSRFASRFSKIDTYVTYTAPNYFLRAGDFRTRLEAERIKSEIEAEFPTSFVVKEKINLPRLEKDEISD